MYVMTRKICLQTCEVNGSQRNFTLVKGSSCKIPLGQAVKALKQRSRILTPVANVSIVSMVVTSPCSTLNFTLNTHVCKLAIHSCFIIFYIKMGVWSPEVGNTSRFEDHTHLVHLHVRGMVCMII